MPASFKDTDPSNLRGLAVWVRDHVDPVTDADRRLIADLDTDLNRIADTIEEGPAVTTLPDWRAF